MSPADDAGDARDLIARYQALVEQYEALDEQIDALLMAYGGHTEDLPADDLRRYRELARQRDDLESDLRALEQQLNLDDDSPTGEQP